jgi:hypothetical protein
MKTILLILAAVVICFTAYAATDARDGVWTAEVDGDTLHVSLFRNRDKDNRWGGNMFGFQLPLASVTLTPAQANATASDVKFTLTRSAGTIAFDGHFAEGKGAGHYHFTPNDAFVKEMQSLGFTDFSDNKLLIFAAEDFSPQTVKELRALGYEVTQREVVDAAIFHINGAAVNEFARLGYPNLSFRELVDMRVGNVDAAYITAMRDLGFSTSSAHQVSEMAILGVKPAYVKELRAAGLADLSPRQITDLRIGNINAEKIAAYKKLGYDLTPHQLSDFGIHHVTPEMITELRAIGYTNISAHDLIEMKIFGVTPDYIRKMEKAGYHAVPVEKLIKLKMSGLEKEVEKNFR